MQRAALEPVVLVAVVRRAVVAHSVTLPMGAAVFAVDGALALLSARFHAFRLSGGALSTLKHPHAAMLGDGVQKFLSPLDASIA